jgi:hypothetical protein
MGTGIVISIALIVAFLAVFLALYWPFPANASSPVASRKHRSAFAPQVEASPDETVVRTIVAKWYGEHTCVYCAQPIREIGGAAVAPALLGSNGELREWNEIAPEDLPEVLASSVAVCARCELAEDFRRRFPNRVTDRPITPLREHAALPVPRHRVVEPPSQAVY